ncbi:hypothetical protein CTAYLR_000882 [Chrysophaeum taylorii]|uniref:PIPK domain-containing protein n=1 Tax=Chrysophaeum taylorii TaxID=2483200 RepID=A0AAD7UFV4_9STRA|nr:hypothetical protein CTAYLR_000882 [Chrysophaeum taylorii]
MAVQWAVRDKGTCATSFEVVYSRAGGESQKASGACYPFSLPSNLNQSNHVANLTGLESASRYEYSVGGFEGSFTTAPDASNIVLPQRFIVYGDMGSSESGPSDSSTVMPAVSREILESRFDMILHVGDFAYDFDSDAGERGAQFMNDIQNVSALVPYMVSVGNHESGFNFAHYSEFFRLMPTDTPWMTTDNGPAPNTHYYSWNVGLVHFVAVSTEIPFDYPDLVASMTNWLEADLAAANENRSFAPWVVAHGHRSLYCSCDSDCDADALALRAVFAQIFYDYGVDLFINGHEHNYERMFDVAPEPDNLSWLSGISTQSTVDMPATTYIITGDAGSDEDHEVFDREQPNRTAFRTDSYGYSRMEIYNATHLHWQQVEYDFSAGVLGDVVDDVWLVQHHHGPFNASFRNPKQAAAAAAVGLDPAHPRHDAVKALLAGLSGLEAPEVTERRPEVFKALRRRWRAQRGLRRMGKSGCASLRLVSGGSRGAARRGGVFLISRDGRFILKQESAGAVSELCRIASDYARYVEDDRSLLPRYVGAYTVACGDTSHWVVMNNVLDVPFRRVAVYDLKGSTAGRKAPSGAATLKDVDAHHADLASRRSSRAIERLDKDTAFLEQNDLLDYSLLVGVFETRRIFFSPATWFFWFRRRRGRRRGVIALRRRRRRHPLKTDHLVLGLIDVLQTWDVAKKIEFVCRGAVHGFDAISAVPPHRYRHRFLAFIKTTLSPSSSSSS